MGSNPRHDIYIYIYYLYNICGAHCAVNEKDEEKRNELAQAYDTLSNATLAQLFDEKLEVAKQVPQDILTVQSHLVTSRNHSFLEEASDDHERTVPAPNAVLPLLSGKKANVHKNRSQAHRYANGVVDF